jgi:hypothetical protein
MARLLDLEAMRLIGSNVTHVNGTEATLGINQAGPGADEVTLTFTNLGVGIADADVWVSTDAAGDTVVAGTKQTNSSGEVTFLLDDGETYYAWMQKDGVESIRAQSFVADAD